MLAIVDQTKRDVKIEFQRFFPQIEVNTKSTISEMGTAKINANQVLSMLGKIILMNAKKHVAKIGRASCRERV